MPVNKNAMIRYQTLDRCFRNSGRMYFMKDLIEECNKAIWELEPGNKGISERTLFNDIRYMESEQGWSIPLERNRFEKKVYYRYVDTGFSINNSPLSNTESEQIRSALSILSRFTGAPQFSWINEIIPLIENKLGIVPHHKQIISLDSNIDLKGINLLPDLFNGIINERVFLLQYQGYKNPEVFDFHFHPYYLKQYNNRWFVIGRHEEYDNNYWTLALDRITSMKETAKHYQKSNMDWEEYFYDVVGVTRTPESEPIEIKLLFSKELAPYIQSKPLHASQKQNIVDGNLEVRICVIPNYELESTILSYGNKVKVIAPDDLKIKIEEKK